VAAVLGLGVGALAIRRQGIYFAMTTLALAQMIYFFCLQAPFTHGEDGIQAVPRGMLFGLIDHGAWTRKAGVSRRAVRVILGNPLIAITMLRHDSEAGLFAPVELLLLEESENTSRLLYVKPSSLMVVNANPPLQEAAAGLDRKLAALAVKIVGE
jgi:hypothetical protein